MKLALVNPPQPQVVNPCVYPPVGLCHLAASVKKHRPEVECDLLDLAGCTIDEAAAKLSGYDVVGYTAHTAGWKECVELARKRKRSYQTQIVGGPHVTITKETNSAFSSYFTGFADFSILKFIDDWKNGVAEKWYPSIPYEMDDLPIPYKCYGKKLNAGGADVTAVVVTSRGCTDKCAFCAARGMQERVRFRSIDHVTSELAHLKGSGITEIRFMDDAFSMSKNRTIEICKAIENFGFRWGCMVRADQLDEDRLAAMREAGCSEVALGVESFDPHVLKVLKKRATVVDNVNAILMANSFGIKCHILLMVSTPGETYKDTIDCNIATLEALRGKYHRMLFSTFMPHPGCDIYRKPHEYGCRIVEWDFSKYNQHQFIRQGNEVVEVPPWSPIRIDGMTEEQQIENIARFRAYALTTGTLNRGVLK